jgi:hypothetical protein
MLSLASFFQLRIFCSRDSVSATFPNSKSKSRLTRRRSSDSREIDSTGSQLSSGMIFEMARARRPSCSDREEIDMSFTSASPLSATLDLRRSTRIFPARSLEVNERSAPSGSRIKY